VVFGNESWAIPALVTSQAEVFLECSLDPEGYDSKAHWAGPLNDTRTSK